MIRNMRSDTGAEEMNKLFQETVSFLAIAYPRTSQLSQDHCSWIRLLMHKRYRWFDAEGNHGGENVRDECDGACDDDGINEDITDRESGMFEGNGLINGYGYLDLEFKDVNEGRLPSWAALLVRIRERIFQGERSMTQFQTRLWYSGRNHTKSLAAACILILVFTSIILMRSGQDRRGIIIDGDFSDWNPDYLTNDRIGDGFPDIVYCGLHLDDLKLSVYLSTRNSIFSGFGGQSDLIRVFIDSDADDRTGYAVLNIGADYLIEIYGNNGIMVSSWYFVFNPLHRTDNPRSNYDWNAWSRMFHVEAALHDNELEAQLWRDELNIPDEAHPVIVAHISGNGESEDFSPVFTDAGSIGVTTRSLLNSDVIPSGVEIPILAVQMRSLGTRGLSINSISFMLYSTLHSHEIVSSKLYSDASAAIIDAQTEGGRLFFTTEEDLTDSVVSEWSYTLSITLTRTVITGHALVVGLSTITTAAGITPFSMEDARAYAVSPPSGTVVDGLYSDWVHTETDDLNDVVDPDVDITANAAVLGKDQTSVYLDVQGDVFNGNTIPCESPVLITRTHGHDVERIESVPMLNTASILPERSGEDTLFIYLGKDDHNPDSTSHEPVSWAIVEIKGRSGILTSCTWYEMNTNGDLLDTRISNGSLEYFSDDNCIEMTIPQGGFEYCWFRMVSWNGNEDCSAEHGFDVDEPYQPQMESVRSHEDDVCINEIFPNPESESQEWVELYNPTEYDVTIEGWELHDRSGMIWTGDVNTEIDSLGTLTISLNNKLRNSGEALSLYDNDELEMDQVEYPTFSSYEGLSFSRISDRNEYFERDPTPTRDQNNNITAAMKINEIYYDVVGSEPEGEFIELINTASGSRTLDDWMVRNDDRVTFDFDAVIDGGDFHTIDHEDDDLDGQSYADCFGQYGLGGSQDFVVLENDKGQVVDRITYASESSSDYYDESGVSVGYDDSADDVDEGHSLGRYPDGYDSDDDSSDFVECTLSGGEENTPIPESFQWAVPIGTILLLGAYSGRSKRITRNGWDPMY